MTTIIFHHNLFKKTLDDETYDEKLPITPTTTYTDLAERIYASTNELKELPNMGQQITKLADDKFKLDLSGEDLAIFYRVFGQEPKEAMRIAEIFEAEPIAFAALSQLIRKQIHDGVDIDELNEAVAKIEADARAAN